MGAEVALLSRMIFRVDEDGVVRTRGHAGFATDADGLVKIDDAVRAFEHGCGWTSGDTWSMSALIATCHLMRASRLGKHSNLDMLDVGPRDGDRHDVFRLACSRTRMTTNAASVVDYLGPLNRVGCFHDAGQTIPLSTDYADYTDFF